MFARKSILLTSAITSTIVCIAACFFWFVIRGATNDIAQVRWHSGGHAMTILARLTDSNGFPIANVVVDSESDSGRAGNVVPTNSNGVVAFSAAEREVRAIYVDGVCVFESDGILSPSIQYGLVVSIRMLNDSTQTTTKTNNGLQQSARPAVLTYVESTARTR